MRPFKFKLGKEAEKIKDDIPFRKTVVGAVVINLMVIISLFLLKKNLPPEVPLYYGLPEGEEQLGNIILLALPSVISLAITFFNLLLGIFIKDEFLFKVLIAIGFASTFLSLVTTFKIIFLVGSF